MEEHRKQEFLEKQKKNLQNYVNGLNNKYKKMDKKRMKNQMILEEKRKEHRNYLLRKENEKHEAIARNQKAMNEKLDKAKLDYEMKQMIYWMKKQNEGTQDIYGNFDKQINIRRVLSEDQRNEFSNSQQPFTPDISQRFREIMSANAYRERHNKELQSEIQKKDEKYKRKVMQKIKKKDNDVQKLQLQKMLESLQRSEFKNEQFNVTQERLRQIENKHQSNSKMIFNNASRKERRYDTLRSTSTNIFHKSLELNNNIIAKRVSITQELEKIFFKGEVDRKSIKQLKQIFPNNPKLKEIWDNWYINRKTLHRSKSSFKWYDKYIKHNTNIFKANSSYASPEAQSPIKHRSKCQSAQKNNTPISGTYLSGASTGVNFYPRDKHANLSP